jgi:integrase
VEARIIIIYNNGYNTCLYLHGSHSVWTLMAATPITTSKDEREINQYALFERKIEAVTEGLPGDCFKSLTKISQDNALTIATYISSVKSETNLSDNYRRDIIRALSKFSIFCSNKPFKSMTRKDDVLFFLDSVHNPEDVDPLHKWIGTYNLYRVFLMRFFKWLYHPDLAPNTRPKPPVIENIGQLKRKEISIYKPIDLWSEEDDLLFFKYCPSKRMKCYHAVSRDTSCRPHEILKLKVKDIVFKIIGNYQYTEILVNGKTGSRQIPLIDSIPYLKDYLDHEHPFPTNHRSPFICGIGRSLGRSIEVGSLFRIYDNYKKEYFPKLLESSNVPPEDKQKIKELLKKPWNPYIRRHTALTEKSLKLKSHVLNQHAGWSQGSVMPQRYLHYFGNESSESILEAYGIIPKDKQQSYILRPKQCPNCNEPNKPDSKFCAKCRMVLTYDAYNETLDSQKEKESEVQNLKDQMRLLQESQREILQCLKHPEKLAQIAKEG